MIPSNEVTTAQISYITGLGDKLHLNRHDLAAKATNLLGKFVKSIDDLTKREASQLIEYLKELTNG